MFYESNEKGKDMANQGLFSFSEKDKKRFEAQVKKLSEEDVIEVMTKFGKKLDQFEQYMAKSKVTPDFAVQFVKGLKTIYELLNDSDFEISWTAKAWFVFALSYFIMPLDLIPDWIPVIGYLDDFALLLMVMDMFADEIERYKRYKKNKKQVEKNNLVQIEKGSANRAIIISSGFLSQPEKYASYKPWIKSIRAVDKDAAIYSFIWDTKSISDLVGAVLRPVNLGGNPFLGIGYKALQIKQVWNDAVMNTSLYSGSYVKSIEALKSTSKSKIKITAIGHSLGARLIFNALSVADGKLVDNLFTVGGAVGASQSWSYRTRKVGKLYNCYSTYDPVLSYLYRIAQFGEKPIGLTRIGKQNTQKRTEIDCSAFVKGHSEYAAAGGKWFNAREN